MADHFQNAADLLAVASELGQHGVVGIQLLMELVDGGLGSRQCLQPLGGDLLHLGDQIARLMGAVGYIANGVAQLGDGGRQLLAVGTLLLQVSIDGLDVAPVIFGCLQDLLVGVGAAPDHGLELGLLHPQGQFNGSQGVAPPGVEYLTEAGSLVLIGKGEQMSQPLLQAPAVGCLCQQQQGGGQQPEQVAGGKSSKGGKQRSN